MALDSQINREKLISHFPKLAHDASFHLLSDATRKYNCIGWAMGTDKRWVTCVNGADYWWPDGVERNTDQEALIHAFEAVGFQTCAGADLEQDYDKVVLYGLNGKWTHAARIVSTQEQYSKFGTGWDAVHGCDVFEDTAYGSVYCYMKRPIADRHKTDDLMGVVGAIKILKKIIWK